MYDVGKETYKIVSAYIGSFIILTQGAIAQSIQRNSKKKLQKRIVAIINDRKCKLYFQYNL